MPRRRWLAATIRPRSATWWLARCGSRATESRATIDAVVLGDVDGGVGMAPERPQVAPLLADAAPAVRGQKPRLRLAADRRAELDERLRRPRARAGRIGPSSDDDAVAAAARIAGGGEACRRRGARRRRRRRSRGCGPPSARSSSRRGGELVRSARPRGGGRRPRRGAAARSIASSTGVAAQDRVGDLGDRAGEPDRAGAAEREPRAAVLEHERRRHHARQPLAGRLRRVRRRRRARRACCSAACRRGRCPSRSRASTRATAAFAVGVDHRDVRRPRDARAAVPPA